MDKILLAAVVCLMMLAAFYGGREYESKDGETATVEKKLVDTAIDLSVDNMSDVSKLEYLNGMLKPLEEDSAGRELSEDQTKQSGCADEEYTNTASSRRLEEERMLREKKCSLLVLDYFMYEQCMNETGAWSE